MLKQNFGNWIGKLLSNVMLFLMLNLAIAFYIIKYAIFILSCDKYSIGINIYIEDGLIYLVCFRVFGRGRAVGEVAGFDPCIEIKNK